MSDSTPETTTLPLYTSAQAAAGSTIPSPEAAPASSAKPAPAPETISTPVSTMSVRDVVQNCRRAYNEVLAVEKALGVSDYDARTKAAEAYCSRMPFLTSEPNISAFIACVGHAMLLHIIRRDEGPKLMSIARAALAALPHHQKSSGRPPSSKTA